MKKRYFAACVGIIACIAVCGTAVYKSGFFSVQTIEREEKKLPYLEAAETVIPEALSEESSLTGFIDDTGVTQNTEVYLSVYFDINIDKDGFYNALHKIIPVTDVTEEESETKEDGDVTEESDTKEESGTEENSETAKDTAFTDTGADMVKAAVISAGKERLAATYSEEKTEERLQFYGIHDTPNKNYSSYDSYPYIVCALDLGLIEEKTAQNALGSTLEREEQLKLLMNVATLTGQGRNYLGYSGDPDIYAKLSYMFHVYNSFEAEELGDIINSVLAEDIAKSCVLKKKTYDAGFLPELTLWYTHTSLAHMEEMIGLLNSENIAAKIQLEPKTVFSKTEDDEVKSTLAYDLVLEFEKKDDLEKFCLLAKEYAVADKTDEANVALTDKSLTDSYTENYFYAKETSGLKSKDLNTVEELRIDSETEYLCFYTPDQEQKDALVSEMKILLGLDELEEATESEETEETAEVETSYSDSLLQQNPIFASYGLYLAVGGTEKETEEIETEENTISETESEIESETTTETETAE